MICRDEKYSVICRDVKYTVMCSKTFTVKKSPVITKLWLKLVWCMFKIVEQWCAQAQFMFEECIHSLMVCYKWQYIYKEPRNEKLRAATAHWTYLNDSVVYWAAVIDVRLWPAVVMMSRWTRRLMSSEEDEQQRLTSWDWPEIHEQQWANEPEVDEQLTGNNRDEQSLITWQYWRAGVLQQC